jgi:hypothetical protein
MKSTILLFIFSFILLKGLKAQEDFGYKTFDVGGSFKWNPDRYNYSLHLAYNAKTYHSIQFHAGYTSIAEKNFTDFSQKGNGWSAGGGYRYYFAVIPKRFFLGTDIEYTQLTIKGSSFVGPYQTKIHFIQPSIQAGYTAVINDQLFITPFGGIAFTVAKNSATANSGFGKNTEGTAGISVGWRF